MCSLKCISGPIQCPACYPTIASYSTCSIRSSATARSSRRSPRLHFAGHNRMAPGENYFTRERTMGPDYTLRSADDLKVPASTICAMFDHAVASVPDKVAIRYRGAALTYRALGRAVASLSRRLAASGAPRDVAAIILPNAIEFHVAYFAAMKARATPALLNPIYPATELAPLLREASPRAVICAPPTRDTLTGLARDLRIPNVVCIGQDVTVWDLVDA